MRAQRQLAFAMLRTLFAGFLILAGGGCSVSRDVRVDDVPVQFRQSSLPCPVVKHSDSVPAEVKTENWAEKSVNFAASAPRAARRWPFAVLVPDPEGDTGLKLFKRHLDVASAMGPRFIVVLGQLDTSSDGRFVVDGEVLDFGPDSVPVPLFVFPGGGSASEQAEPLAVRCAPAGRLLFLPWKGVCAEGGAAEDLQRWVRAELAGMAAGEVLVVVLEGAPWNSPRCDAWSQICKELSTHPGDVWVVDAKGEHCLWWQWKGQNYLTVAPIRLAATGVAADTGYPQGLLWGALAPGGATFHLLTLDGVMSVQSVAKALQDDLAMVRQSFSATCCDPHRAMTTVSGRNPTAQKMVFQAEWSAVGGKLQADPQIVSFELAPGQAFEQQFRLTLPGSQMPLMFAQPSLVLTTSMRDGSGYAVPFTFSVTPACRMAGEALRFDTPPRLDGELGEWISEGAGVEHVSQVVAGQDFWTGPADLSGLVFVGVQEETLYLAGMVHDSAVSVGQSQGKDIRVAFAVATSSEQARDGTLVTEEGVSPEHVCVRLRGDGQCDVEGVSVAGAVQSVVKMMPDGFGVEIALPATVIPGLASAASVLVDFSVTDNDADGASSLSLSGTTTEGDRGWRPAEFAIPRSQNVGTSP